MKFRINFDQCGACKGVHAHWWFNSKVQPPSCKERQKRQGKT